MPLPPSPSVCRPPGRLLPHLASATCSAAVPSQLTAAPSKNLGVVTNLLATQPHPFHQQTCTLCLQNIPESLPSPSPPCAVATRPRPSSPPTWVNGPWLAPRPRPTGCIPASAPRHSGSLTVLADLVPATFSSPGSPSLCHSQAGRGWQSPKVQPTVMPPTLPLAVSWLSTPLALLWPHWPHCCAQGGQAFSSGPLHQLHPLVAQTLSPCVTVWLGSSPAQAFAYLWAPMRPFLSPHPRIPHCPFLRPLLPGPLSPHMSPTLRLTDIYN